jgi:hypothetical protein
MAAVGPLADARSAIVTEITNAGYAAVTDPRNARPLSVFVELPTITAVTNKVLDLTFTLRVLGAPPGNQDSLDWIFTAVDTLIQVADLAVVAGSPSLAQIGTQELPAYDLTVRYGTHTTP